MSETQTPAPSRAGHFAYVVGRQLVRSLGRVSPKLVDLGYAVFKDECGAKAITTSAVEAKTKPVARAELESQLATPASTSAEAVKLATLTVNGVQFKLAVTKEDLGSFWADYARRGQQGTVYEPYMLACATRLLLTSQDPRFMDIGAYLGYFAFYAAALLRDQHEVYAIESNGDSVEAMRESVRVNDFSNLHVIQAALSDRVEMAKIGLLTVSTQIDGKSGNTLETITLDDLCRQNGWSPNIIKIDVHGADGKVIFGMRDTLKRTDALLLELHRLPLLAKYSPGISRNGILDALEDAGLTLYYVAGQSSLLDGAIEPPDFEELLAGRGFSYCRLDKPSRPLLLFDRSHDEFILALRGGDDAVEALLGKSVSMPND